MKIVWRLLINAVALWIAAELVPGVMFEGEFLDLFLVAVIFGLVNTFVRPIAKLLTFPINVITLGLFTFVVNAFTFMLTAAVAGSLSIDGGFSEQFLTSLLAALLISIVSVVLSWVLPDGE